MKFTIISILLSLFCREIKALINFPHIDIFSYGYNLLNRNPYEEISTISIDSNFSLFSLTYKQNKATPDQMYRIPDNITLYSIRFCPNETSYYEIFGETSYFNFLSESIKTPDNFSGNFEKGAFSNSPEFQRISLENYANDNLIVYVLNECSVYLMESQTLLPKLSPNFVDVIKKLMFNNDNDTKAFSYIFDKFGTHYILKIIFGSKTIKESKISRPSYQSFSFKLFEIKNAAINSFLNWTGNSLNEKDKWLAYDWEEMIEDKQIIFGANPEPNPDGKNELWFNSSKLSPAPLYYELDYIYNLIDKKYFPEIDSQILANFKAKLMIQIEAYCKDKAGTRFLGPRKDKKFPSYRIMKGKEKVESKDGPNHMTSPPSDFPEYASYSANGVGIQRVPGNSTSNFHFYFFQDFRVACSNDIGSTCYMTYTPYKTTSYRNIVTCPSYDSIGVCVACPTGYVATSCGYKPNSLLHEPNPEVFPLDNKTCKCFHSKGVDCQVICLNDDSKRIQKSYEIVQANGINEFKVLCPKYKSSFGCGFKSSKIGDAGPWWVYPIPNGCVCYSQNQAICHAICVDFYDYEQVGDCSGCLVSKCQKDGCQIDGCEDSYFYDSINKKCMPKPCYENCKNCTTLNSCSYCASVCSQTENPLLKTCNSDYMIQGCLPCKPNKYRNSFGFCTSCDVKNDPEKYRSGGNEGNGVCKLCSELIENCELCNTEYMPECWKCKSYFFLDQNSHCTLCDNNTFYIVGLNDGTGKCRSCFDEYDENCLVCNESICITCKVGYFFSIKDRKCNNCSLLNLCCEECNSSMCISCSVNHIFDGNGGCLACDIGYFLSMSNYECTPCSSLHSFCNQCDSSVCLHCLGNHKLDDNGGCLACEMGYFLSINNYECYPCSDSHQFCENCNSSICLRCSGNHIVDENGGCLACEIGYFLSILDLQCCACSVSHPFCDECNSLKCFHCLANHILDGNGGCLSCEIGYYLSITNYECYPCSGSNPFCDQCNSSMCFHCSGNHIFDGNGGCLACKKGYFLSITNNDCYSCSALRPFCDECNYLMCLHCLGNHNFDGNGGCLACEIGYFLSLTNNECYPCSDSHPFCEDCNSSACLRCSGNHILDGNGGCLACKIGYFLSITDQQCYDCLSSHPFCDICNSSVCLHCLGNHIFDGNGECLACEIGYFLSITNNECYSCSVRPFCYQCNSSMCLHCLGNHILDGYGGCLACEIGYFLSITNQQCYVCSSSHPFCDQCNSSICLHCLGNHTLDGKGGCLACEKGYFLSITNFECYSCSSLRPFCDQCNSSICLHCLGNHTLDGKGGCLACEKGYFLSITNNECYPCTDFHPFCENCNSSMCLRCSKNHILDYNGRCEACESGYFLSITDHQCSACSDSYPFCDICNSLVCLHCSGNHIFDSNGGCLACKIGYFLSLINFECYPCSDSHLFCEKCTSTTCLICSGNHILDGNGGCLACEIGYFLSITNQQCYACSSSHPFCDQCNSSICLHCLGNHTLDGNGGCLACEKGYFLSLTNNECYSCSLRPFCDQCNSSMCLHCLGNHTVDASGGCLACKMGSFLSLTNNDCYPCSDSHQFCENCNSSHCLKCLKNHILDDNGGCLACEIGYFLSITDHQCYPCSSFHPFCDQCNSSACFHCSVNHMFDGNGGCLACIVGYFLSITNNECYPCSDSHPFCENCNSSMCLRCSGKHILDGNGGCLACEIGYFLSITDQQCYACSSSHSFCDKCNSFMCLHCSGNHILDGNGGCLACERGYFLSLTNNECYSCSARPFCDQCNSLMCLHCLGNHTFDGSGGCLACKVGYFLSTINNECYPCLDSYPFCENCNSSMCLRCSGNHILDGNGGCLACEIGYFLSITDYQCYACFDSHPFCDKCNSLICLHCLGNHILDGNGGCLACEIGYYLSLKNFECYSCSDSRPFCEKCTSSMCLICSGNHIFDGNGGCLACEIGYFLSRTNYECYACSGLHPFCDKCNSSMCFHCSGNHIMDDKGECLACEIGYFLSPTNKECYSCSALPFCEKCTSSMCLSCSKNHILDGNGGCLACEIGYFLSMTNYECSSCSVSHPFCDQCNSKTCFKCTENYALDQNGECNLCTGKYIEVLKNGAKICRNCSDFFYECSFCNNNICVICKPGFYLSKEKICIRCESLNNNALSNIFGNEKCNYCSGFFENCLSCNEDSCFQCLSDTFHENSKTCSPCLNKTADVCSECPSIKNCQKCEYLNFQTRCIKCNENFFMTPRGDCVLCNQLENVYIFENIYCLKLALPKYQTNSLLIPNQTFTEENFEFWIISQVCSLNDTVTSYKTDFIIVYWSAIQTSKIDFDDSFENIKNMSIHYNNSKDFKEYQSFGYSSYNQILLNLASNITYKILYYCEIPFNHINKNKKGEFFIKRIQNLTLSAKIIMEFSRKSDNFVGTIESEDQIICLLEKLLNQEEKFLISKRNGDFCNAINNNVRDVYNKYFSSLKSIVIFNFKSNPFLDDSENNFKQFKIKLNSSDFQTKMNKNLSFSNLDKIDLVTENINEDISVLPIKNNNLSVDHLLFYSNSTENNFDSQSYNWTVVFTLKPTEDKKIIIYAFSIFNSSEERPVFSPIFNGEELDESKFNITFDFKGKSYLKSSSSVNLSLILLEKNKIIDLYFCVADLNLKNSTEIAFSRFTGNLLNISEPGSDELSEGTIAGLIVGVVLGCFLLILGILVIIKKRRNSDRNPGYPPIQNLEMRRKNNHDSKIQIPDEARQAMNNWQ